METFLHNNSHENPKRPTFRPSHHACSSPNSRPRHPFPFSLFRLTRRTSCCRLTLHDLSRCGRALAEIHTRRGICVEIGGNGLACATEIVFGSALRSPQRARRATASAITTRSRIAEMATVMMPPAGPPTSPVFGPGIVGTLGGSDGGGSDATPRAIVGAAATVVITCLLYTSPSPRD